MDDADPILTPQQLRDLEQIDALEQQLRRLFPLPDEFWERSAEQSRLKRAWWSAYEERMARVADRARRLFRA